MTTQDLRTHGLSRREAAALLLSAAGLALLPRAARALQPAPGGVPPTTSTPDPAAPSFLDGVLAKGKTRDRTLRVVVNVDAYQTPLNRTPKDQLPDIRALKFDTAAIVFPVIDGCASSQTAPADKIVGVMKFDDRPRDAQVTFLENYQAGARLGKWELKNCEGRQATLDLDIPMSSWRTEFNEKAASRAIWPADGKWGKASTSALQPQMFVESTDAGIADRVRTWTSGKDPKSISPVQLAKFLAGKVIESVQPSGTGQVGNKRNNQFAGLELLGAARTLREGKGTEHDMTCALTAVYRAAGLPARVVVAHQAKSSGSAGGGGGAFNRASSGPNLRSWVEFCLYDAPAQRELWVPVDPLALRRSSSRAQPLDRTWKHFGTHDELDDCMPFTFHFHPPTTVVAHGAVAFWGWLTTPETQIATQWLTFSSITTPKGPGDVKPPSNRRPAR